ncbi:hypothetical protein GCU56_00905 [Geodermatophilus sabuli]|uniref:Uncharacterized protein n=1 Tax=Geodermatophilus sabuli TaxID=1564158 RepID=A0A7K3VWI3_9ACTN|nr:hypothetical protein [Geodermatophilus sabuli]NEK56433.1 hypothetical protein [Geodermatophilus sabuli]
MDITTVNDRHLYQARVLVRDPEDPAGRADLPHRVVRFGPPGWLTVADGSRDGAEIVLYPTSQVLAVSHLREVDAARPPGTDAR